MYKRRVNRLVLVALCAAMLVSMRTPAGAQGGRIPTARLVSAPALRLPVDIDSNTPVVRDLVDGVPTLFMLASWGGASSRLSGPRG